MTAAAVAAPAAAVAVAPAAGAAAIVGSAELAAGIAAAATPVPVAELTAAALGLDWSGWGRSQARRWSLARGWLVAAPYGQGCHPLGCGQRQLTPLQPEVLATRVLYQHMEAWTPDAEHEQGDRPARGRQLRDMRVPKLLSLGDDHRSDAHPRRQRGAGRPKAGHRLLGD